VASFTAPRSANGGYDFTCYGPNGFQRRFAGNIQIDCGQIEVSSQVTPDGNIALALANTSSGPVNFTVTDNLNAGTNWLLNLPAASGTNLTFGTLNTNNGWYDLTATADADTNFLRHFAGHIETGAPSFTEVPAIVGDPLLWVTTTTTNTSSPSSGGSGSVLDVVNGLIAQNALVAGSSNAPILNITAYGTNCALIYAGWTSNCAVDYKTTLFSTAWTQLDAPTITISNWNVLVLSATNSGAFFRLRQ
jgi:hypothetical protein